MASEIKEVKSPLSQCFRAYPRTLPSSVELSTKLYLLFWHAYSPVMYSLYKIDVHVPKRAPHLQTKDEQTSKMRSLSPILQLNTGEYPNNMCSVSFDSKMYFFGGEYNINDLYISEDVKKKLKNEERGVFPPEVYIFDLTTPNSDIGASGDSSNKLLVPGTPMKSGKARPQAFVADEKIYVVGSNFETNISDKSKLKDLNLEDFVYFEVYDREKAEWTTLPNPPNWNLKFRWVRHVVVERKAILVARQQGKERLYCFDLDKSQWTKYASHPSYPGNFSGRIEYVEGTFYGCYHNTVAAIAKVGEEKEEEEEEEEAKEEEEEKKEEEVEEEEKEIEEEEEEEAEEEKEVGKEIEEEEGEEQEIEEDEAEEEKEEENEIEEAEEEKEDEKEIKEEDAVQLLKNHQLHLVSGEMGMDAIFSVPPQLHSSSSLLHLGHRYFCYVRTGMRPHSKYGSDNAKEDDERCFINIVIFLALGDTYKEEATRLFRAEFLHSAHYVVDPLFPMKGFINGCFSHGLMFDSQLDSISSSSSILEGTHLDDSTLSGTFLGSPHRPEGTHSDDSLITTIRDSSLPSIHNRHRKHGTFSKVFKKSSTKIVRIVGSLLNLKQIFKSKKV